MGEIPVPTPNEEGCKPVCRGCWYDGNDVFIDVALKEVGGVLITVGAPNPAVPGLKVDTGDWMLIMSPKTFGEMPVDWGVG